VKDEFERKTILCSIVPYGCPRGEETFLIKKGYLGNFLKGNYDIKNFYWHAGKAY